MCLKINAQVFYPRGPNIAWNSSSNLGPHNTPHYFSHVQTCRDPYAWTVAPKPGEDKREEKKTKEIEFQKKKKEIEFQIFKIIALLTKAAISCILTLCQALYSTYLLI